MTYKVNIKVINTGNSYKTLKALKYVLMACMNFKLFIYLLHFIKNIWVVSLFIKTGSSPLYVIEMIIKFCASLEFCVSLDA